MRRRIVLVGVPGSGKGTQSSLLAEQLDVPSVSSGQLLRNLARSGTETGREIARDLDRGELVPDDLIATVVRDTLASRPGGYILEGFPRTVAQARRAETFLEPDAVIHLVVPDEVARARLAHRDDPGRTDDAQRAVIDRRLRRFHDEIEPILRHYRDRDVLTEVDADRPPDAVHNAIMHAVQHSGRTTEHDNVPVEERNGYTESTLP